MSCSVKSIQNLQISYQNIPKSKYSQNILHQTLTILFKKRPYNVLSNKINKHKPLTLLTYR